MTFKAYSIQVSGIRCTNCAGKIEKAVNQALKGYNMKISVNILQEKVFLTIQEDKLLDITLETLKKAGFQAIGQPVMVSGGQQHERSIAFQMQQNEQSSKLLNQFTQTLGITRVTQIKKQGTIILNIRYNSQIIKGRQIADAISIVQQQYEVKNYRVQSFKGLQNEQQNKKSSILLASLLCFHFFFGNMIIPNFSTEYMKLLYIPQYLGIFSLAVILNIILALYVLRRFSKPFIVNAYNNYVEFKSTNMETLVALGCVSALGLFLFFLVRYSFDSYYGQLQNRQKAIMNLIDALTSASIIVLVVTIGKHYQSKIKRKINKITNSIFPESCLFNNMKVNFIQLKNRNLLIKNEKVYDVSLIEKNDILKLETGRLLVDVVVISGKIKATQSATHGSEDIIIYEKGQRIQSGAIIHENIQGLVQVENVFEKSMLVQIGTQIKLAQNQQQTNQSGIQVVCKKIASFFVKGVVILSLSVMAIWSFLLFFNYVEVPTCHICWIVERGIGVLVASCPCALGLAVPTVIAIILNLATKSGILIRNNNIFEKMKKAKIVAFDKTGTLFTCIQKIQNFSCLDKSNESQVWEIVALIEKQIRHPLAEILYKEAFNRCKINGTNFNFLLLEKPEVQKQGIKTTIRNKLTKTDHKVLIGNCKMMRNYEVEIPNYEKTQNASTQLFLSVSGQIKLIIFLNTHSNLRPEAAQAIKKIKELGKQVHILSGDSKESVSKLCEQLDIPEHCQHAQHSAFMKKQWIIQQQKDNNNIIMVGDGLNDIPCLQQASIGISINAKSELNINAADVVLLSENLYKILALIRLINKGNLFIKINLFWAFIYNLTIMPFVAGVFYKYDLYVSPVWSSIAMSASSILVVFISQLLLCYHFDDSIQTKQKKKSQLIKDIRDVGVTFETLANSAKRFKIQELNEEIK